MKTMKRILCLVMALMLVAALGATALATGESAVITVKNPTVGVTYKAYKIFDVTYNGTGSADNNTWTYYFNRGDSAWTAAATTLGTCFDYNKTNHAVTRKSGVNDAAVTAAVKAYVEGTTLTPAASAAATGITLDLQVGDAGYYYVKGSQTNAVVTLDTAQPNVTIEDKTPNEPTPGPNGYKSVCTSYSQDGKELTWGNSVDAEYGDTVSFKIEFNAVNYIVKTGVNNGKPLVVYQYKVEEIPTGLKDVTIKQVLMGAKAGEQADVTGKTNYYTYNAETKTLTFAWATGEGTAASPYVPKYASSQLVTIIVTGVVNNMDWTDLNGNEQKDAGEENVVAQNSTKITYNEGSDPYTPPTPPVVKSYSLTVNTWTGTPSAKTAGASYAIDGSYVKVENGVYRPAVGQESGVSFDEIPGSFVIKGLKNGTYVTTMTGAPNGYNVPATDYQKNGVINNADATLDFYPVKGIQLPTTGGMGTTLFYVLGTVMVLGAVVLFVTKKRVDSKG